MFVDHSYSKQCKHDIWINHSFHCNSVLDHCLTFQQFELLKAWSTKKTWSVSVSSSVYRVSRSWSRNGRASYTTYRHWSMLCWTNLTETATTRFCCSVSVICEHWTVTIQDFFLTIKHIFYYILTAFFKFIFRYCFKWVV